MIGKPHILTVTDVQRGIQSLAAFLLGDASLWTELVSANNLTPPYITLDASQIYGPAVMDTSLSSTLSQGSDTITIVNQPANINGVYLSYAGSSGLVAEHINIEKYDGTTIILSTPTQNAYPKGARLQLFSSYNLQNKVLLPGDVLFVPVAGLNTFTVTDQQNLTDAFGSDISSLFDFSNGDLSTVSGLNTLIQRLTIALQTELGSLPLHPQFGSRLNQTIGTPTGSVKWSAVVNDCLTRLPEVNQVTNIQVNAQGNFAYISCLVYVNTSDAPIQMINEAFTLTQTAIS